MLSPSNASQMMLKNISLDDKIISSKIDFLIHLTIIYTGYNNETEFLAISNVHVNY